MTKALKHFVAACVPKKMIFGAFRKIAKSDDFTSVPLFFRTEHFGS
jgi:hypothetical protein